MTNYTYIISKSIIINMMNDWRGQLASEFENAERARADENEGRARVCARRAAGIAIREYYARQGIPVSGTSAYDLLGRLIESPEIRPDLKENCIHLTLKVSEDFRLPVNVDLIEESRKLCSALLPDWMT
jgi:HEPN domain-containing protein